LRIVCGDLEANGFLDQATKVHCGVFKDINTNEIKKFKPDDVQSMLEYLNTVDVLIMHNELGYDLPLLEKLYGYVFKGQKIDTLIMSRLLNPKRTLPPNCQDRSISPHSIEAWGYRVGRGKPAHDDWDTYSEEMLHRCTEDTEILHLVYKELLNEANGTGWDNAFKLSFKLFEYLQKQSEYGWLADNTHINFCISQLTRWIARIDSVLQPSLPSLIEVEETKKAGEFNYVKKPYLNSGKPSASLATWLVAQGLPEDSKIVGGPFTRISFRKINLDSNMETKGYLLAEGWEPLEWNINDDGERSSPKMSKDDPFEGINGKVGKLVAKRVQCRQRRSILEGLQNLIRPDGRIASNVASMAVTGRLTHRGIVNIPGAKSFYGKQLRKVFTSKPGYVLVGTDSDSCQLRMLGGRMESQAYIDAIVSGDKDKGTDLHSLTKKIGELDSRDTAKKVMYCMLFGGGDNKIAKAANQPGKGTELRAKLYKGFDGLGELMQRLSDEWKRTAKKRFNPRFNRMEYYDGFITGLDGRPVLVTSEHQLLVYLLQSDEAIMMSAAYIRVNKQLEKKYKWGIDYGIVCFYHDEFTIECREEVAEDVKQISEEAIAWAGKFYGIKCPHVGHGAIGKNWYDIH